MYFNEFQECNKCERMPSLNFRRSVTVSEDYALPFADILPEYPTMEDMKDLFATKKTIHELLSVPVTWEKNV